MDLHRMVMTVIGLETGRRVIGVVGSGGKRKAWSDLLAWLDLLL